MRNGEPRIIPSIRNMEVALVHGVRLYRRKKTFGFSLNFSQEKQHGGEREQTGYFLKREPVNSQLGLKGIKVFGPC